MPQQTLHSNLPHSPLKLAIYVILPTIMASLSALGTHMMMTDCTPQCCHDRGLFPFAPSDCPFWPCLAERSQPHKVAQPWAKCDSICRCYTYMGDPSLCLLSVTLTISYAQAGRTAFVAPPGSLRHQVPNQWRCRSGWTTPHLRACFGPAAATWRHHRRRTRPRHNGS